MTKEDYLAIAEQYYDEFVSLEQNPNFYDYEKSFIEFLQKMGKTYMESQLNEASHTQDRRKKNDNYQIRQN